MKKGLYLKAFKLITHKPIASPYCCDALRDVGKDKTDFIFYFKPNTSYISWWIGTTEESQLQRSIALLLMHEMERTGSL